MRRSLTLKGWSGDRNTVDMPEQPKKPRAKKDRKNWCGGHVGREHKKEWVLDDRFSSAIRDWWQLKCVTCGRHFESCYSKSKWMKEYDCRCGHHTPEP
jgi:hypothetical protein